MYKATNIEIEPEKTKFDMTREDYLKVARHLKRHVEELQDETFDKDRTYLYVVVDTRTAVLKWMHDMIYIMREKLFKGYEEIDFRVDVNLPEDHINHKFSAVNAESFVIVNSLLNKLDFMPAAAITLEPRDAEIQLQILEKLLVDFSVAIALLKEHYNINQNFDNIVL